MSAQQVIAESPSLLSADGLLGIVFLIMIAVTIAGAFIAATAERLVRALSCIVICFTDITHRREAIPFRDIVEEARDIGADGQEVLVDIHVDTIGAQLAHFCALAFVSFYQSLEDGRDGGARKIHSVVPGS